MEHRQQVAEPKAEHGSSRVGWRVFIGLALFTAIEFVVSTAVTPALPYLVPLALIKAGLILVYFMHVRQLWKRAEVKQ